MKDHTTFGGYIYPSDFDTECTYTNKRESFMAKRIMADWKFDAYCLNNRKITQNKYSHI